MYELTNANKGEPLLEDMAGRYPARLDNFLYYELFFAFYMMSIIHNMQFD